jgi:urease accessory protein
MSTVTMSTVTRIEVHRRDGRATCTFRGGHLSPRRIEAPDGRVRVALVATVALLLAGDEVRIEVVVGAGMDLEIVEIAGTVAYDMRGGSATWDVDVRVEDGGLLVWAGLPFVVAGGADVMRSTAVTLDGDARAVLRETYVFGRSGEVGGDLRASMTATHAGTPLLVEDLDLRRTHRVEPAVMGSARCLDAVTVLGGRLAAGAGILQLDGPGSIDRRLLDEVHRSDVGPQVQVASDLARRDPAHRRWLSRPSQPGQAAAAPIA